MKIYCRLAYIPILIIGLSACATTHFGANENSIYNDSYYSAKDAENDALRAKNRRLKQEQEYQQQQLQLAKEAQERANIEAQTNNSQISQQIEQQPKTPNDFDSYAEYRAYVDEIGSAPKKQKIAQTNSEFAQQNYYPSSPNPYAQQQTPNRDRTTVVNNYYLDNSPYDPFYSPTSSLMLVSLDPWYCSTYRLQYRTYNPYWYSPYPSAWNYPRYGYNYYWLSPYWPYPHYGFYGYENYNHGFHDGYYAGRNSSWYYYPNAHAPSSYGREVIHHRRPSMASMGGYGRAQRSMTAATSQRAASTFRGTTTASPTGNSRGYSDGGYTRRARGNSSYTGTYSPSRSAGNTAYNPNTTSRRRRASATTHTPSTRSTTRTTTSSHSSGSTYTPSRSSNTSSNTNSSNSNTTSSRRRR